MSDVLLVQNTRIEGSGTLGDLLQADGFKINSVFAKEEALPSETLSLLVLLGAPESANDSLSYLKEEQRLIRMMIISSKINIMSMKFDTLREFPSSNNFEYNLIPSCKDFKTIPDSKFQHFHV